MSKILCLVSLLLLSACVTPEPELVYLPEFDQNMAKKQMEKGKNTIVGSSFLTTIGGDIKKCSGRIVMLIPATKYAEKRMNALYAQNGDGFYIPVSVKHQFKSVKETDESNYLKFMRKTVCDVDGKFEFEKVGDGSFFVVSSVVWGVDGRNGIINYYGGGMMLPVTVKNGETKKIVVTR